MESGSANITEGSATSIWPKRYTVVFLCFLATTICFIDRVNISVAVIAMKESLGWSETTKGLVLSSFFVGYTLMMIPSGILANRFGGKIVLGVAVCWWSVATVLTPLAATASIGVLIAARMMLGLGEAGTFPASYAIFSQWVPSSERSRSVAFLMSGNTLGTLIGLFATGLIVENYGWPMAFYLSGGLGFVWAIVWFRKAQDDPKSHPRITLSELKLLSAQEDTGGQKEPIPWKLLLSKLPIWAAFFNHFCMNWTTYLLLGWLPSYFRDVQGVSITSAAIYSAIPWLTQFVMYNLSGWMADLMIRRGLSTNFVRKLMQSIGLSGPAVFLFLLAGDITSALHATILLSSALGLSSFTSSGMVSAVLEMAPKHSSVLIGISSTLGTIPGIIAVAVTGWLVDVTGTYTSTFMLAAGLGVLGTLVWLAFGTTKRVI